MKFKRRLFALEAFTKTVAVNGQEYQLELIDTAGQDELSIVSQSHSMNLDGYVLVYSVTSEKRLVGCVHQCMKHNILHKNYAVFIALFRYVKLISS
jgi:GTPase SAR1 family protein